MKFRVTYEKDEAGWWVATAQGVEGVHTQGRTIGEARRFIREALEAAIGAKARTATLEDDVRLPLDVKRIMKEAKEAQRRLEAEKELARVATEKVLKVLREKLHLSVRDMSELLGVSHQRIHQLTKKAQEAGRAP